MNALITPLRIHIIKRSGVERSKDHEVITTKKSPKNVTVHVFKINFFILYIILYTIDTLQFRLLLYSTPRVLIGVFNIPWRWTIITLHWQLSCSNLAGEASSVSLLINTSLEFRCESITICFVVRAHARCADACCVI